MSDAETEAGELIDLYRALRRLEGERDEALKILRRGIINRPPEREQIGLIGHALEAVDEIHNLLALVQELEAQLAANKSKRRSGSRA